MNGKDLTREQLIAAMRYCVESKTPCVKGCPMAKVKGDCWNEMVLAAADMLERDGSNSGEILVMVQISDEASYWELY